MRGEQARHRLIALILAPLMSAAMTLVGGGTHANADPWAANALGPSDNWEHTYCWASSGMPTFMKNGFKEAMSTMDNQTLMWTTAR